MNRPHPKSVRRRLLEVLYERYQQNPIDMPGPADLMEAAGLDREDLIPNMHYLSDRGLVEMMMGYSPPMFSAARITAAGIDVVENWFELNLQFPAAPGGAELQMADVPRLMEQLVEEADFSPIDGEERRTLLRDIQYLREELSRPVGRWRTEVVFSLLGWIGAHLELPHEHLPSLGKLQSALVSRMKG